MRTFLGLAFLAPLFLGMVVGKLSWEAAAWFFGDRPKGKG